MPLSKCPRTGKLFDNSLGPVHPSVKEEEEKDYETLLDYINAHPHCAPIEAVEGTGVGRDVLQRLIGQGRVMNMSQDEAAEFLSEQEQKAKDQADFNRRLQQQIGQARSTTETTESEKTSVRAALDEKRRR